MTFNGWQRNMMEMCWGNVSESVYEQVASCFDDGYEPSGSIK
jgi:hypothetical protein